MSGFKHRINYTSVFFSTVYSKVYYIVSALTIALMMEFITTVNININNNITYWLALIVYTAVMWILYVACKKHRKKHNKLEIKHIKMQHITLKLIIMLLYTAVATVVISAIHIGVLVLTLK